MIKGDYMSDINIVNGSIVGVHLGAPMQDATPSKPEDNEVYATERNTVTRIGNAVDTWDEQPVPSGGASGGGSTEEWFEDGDTHIWIDLTEGRTSPIVGLFVNGTVTVDWGDGSTPDTLTGKSTANTLVITPVHEYAKVGNYVITISGDGKIGFYGANRNATSLFSSINYNSNNNENNAYRAAVTRIECGSNVSNINSNAFTGLYRLREVRLPNNINYLGSSAFAYCYALRNVTIPDSVTTIADSCFKECYSLNEINIPNGVTKLEATFTQCKGLGKIVIPPSVTAVNSGVFQYCYSLAICDFSQHTTVPNLNDSMVFQGTPSDCQILVPAALVNDWKAATNWSNYADKIVGV